jgi:RNA-directed DNA polymerase
MTLSGGASSATTLWNSVDWKTTESDVRRLQVRIAKAVREGRWGKVKALQRLLTHSHSAKLLAVRRVTQNRGRHTPGVDGTIWRKPNQKWLAALALTHRGYRASPLRRIYIPKKNGKKRPLGLPVMHDRAMQALYLMALEPVAETQADIHSYGFRPGRSTADAIERCFNVLCKRTCAQWILEGDIKGCFDNIDHGWLYEHIPMDRRVLRQWLASGYLEGRQLFPTLAGTPQGGVISPCLANMVLDGLEDAVARITKPSDKVHVIRYADDFVVTGASREMLEHRIKPVIAAFLADRGLRLSEEKTRITSVHEGFDFLGFNVRKYGRKLLIKPSKSSIKSFLTGIREEIKRSVGGPVIGLIRRLNQKIRGWVNYYRHVVAKRAFRFVDYVIFWAVWKWSRRRHPNKSAKWRYKKYFAGQGKRQWVFHAHFVSHDSVIRALPLIQASDTPIRRYRQLIAAATPYDPAFFAYFEHRSRRVAMNPPWTAGSLANDFIRA